VPHISLSGVRIYYEELGSGAPIVLIPGRRADLEAMRPLAEPLSRRYRCVIYDRRNCGRSDVLIAGDAPEHEIWAKELEELIEVLHLQSPFIGGWSSGCRVALSTAIRRPDLVKALLLGWVSGGGGQAVRHLAYVYYDVYIQKAQQGGMEAITNSKFFGERIRMNPSNRDRLLSMNVAEFISVMQRWSHDFKKQGDSLLLGMTRDQVRGIRAPTCILAGDDEVHTPEAAAELHGLLHRSELHGPLITRDEWERLARGFERDQVRAARALPIFESFLERCTKECS